MVYRDMKPVPSFTSASDSNLLREAHRLAHDERQATAALIACLAEVDTRRLYLGEGCGSLFAWCTDVLHLSRDAAYAKLRRAQDLLRHTVPNGDPGEIFDRALTLLVAQLEKQKWAAAGRPGARRQRTSSGRSIPATVRRAVSRRDEERCTFVGAHGRCAETGGLEFHHVVPFAYGGAATEENIQLRCRAHNQYEARRDFPPVLREDSIHDGAPRLENAWLIRCV